MILSYAGLLVLAVSLCAGNGWARDPGRGRGSDHSYRNQSGYHSGGYHEQRYEWHRTPTAYPSRYPAPMRGYRGEPVRVACPPRQIWQPGCWVIQDVGCGRYQQVWWPGRYVVVRSR